MLSFKQFNEKQHHKKHKRKNHKIPAIILNPDYDDLKNKFIEKEKRIKEDKTYSIHNSGGTKQLEKELHEKYKDFTPEEKKNILNYSKHSFHLNGHLIASHHLGLEPKSNPNFHKINTKYDLNTMDHMLTRKKLGRKMDVFSGTGFDPRTQTSESGHLHLPAYTSTSISKHAAYSFAKERKSKDEDKHMIHIHLQHHDTGAYIGTPTGYIHEREFVLPRNTTLKIHHSERDKEDPSLWIHHATVEHNVDPSKIERNPDVAHNLHSSFHQAFNTEHHNSDISKKMAEHHIKMASDPNTNEKTLHDIVNKSNNPNVHKAVLDRTNNTHTMSKIAKKYGMKWFNNKNDIHKELDRYINLYKYK